MAATFEALEERTFPFGRNAYVEVARKRLREGGDESQFLVLSRGYFEKDGAKRWTRFVTLPDDAELKAWIAKALGEV